MRGPGDPRHDDADRPVFEVGADEFQSGPAAVEFSDPFAQTGSF